MTPERQKWWDSLPAEEKRVRRSIEWQQENIRHIKALWNNDELAPEETIEGGIREAKKAIKALRKQIGLSPIGRASRNDPTGSCPTCNDLVIRREHDCCAGCGQKLRWE